MLSFHAHLKVFVATAPCDLRANFNGLWTAAQERLGEDPKSGALFVFGGLLGVEWVILGGKTAKERLFMG